MDFEYLYYEVTLAAKTSHGADYLSRMVVKVSSRFHLVGNVAHPTVDDLLLALLK
jgi:hypothetical protein